MSASLYPAATNAASRRSLIGSSVWVCGCRAGSSKERIADTHLVRGEVELGGQLGDGGTSGVAAREPAAIDAGGIEPGASTPSRSTTARTLAIDTPSRRAVARSDNRPFT